MDDNLDSPSAADTGRIGGLAIAGGGGGSGGSLAVAGGGGGGGVEGSAGAGAGGASAAEAADVLDDELLDTSNDQDLMVDVPAPSDQRQELEVGGGSVGILHNFFFLLK